MNKAWQKVRVKRRVRKDERYVSQCVKRPQKHLHASLDAIFGVERRSDPLRQYPKRGK